MKHCRYHPEFNWQVYGAAEKRADQYWKQRKLSQAVNNSNEENQEKSPQIAGHR